MDEDLAGFLEDFDAGGLINGEAFLAVRDMPDEIRALSGVNSQSTYYEILVITQEAQRLGIDGGAQVSVGGVLYRVRERLMIDDGAFSLCSLAKV